MAFEEALLKGTKNPQHQQRQSFAAQTADRIRASEHCLFSLLPSDELARLAAGWYEACSQAMLRHNFTQIDKWIRSQAATAAAAGFAQDDVLELLRICRNSAFETEGWNKTAFAKVEEVIKQAVLDTSGWLIPSNLDIVTELPPGFETSLMSADEHAGERRTFVRNRLQIPIRLRSSEGQSPGEAFCLTRSISRGGVYFVTRGNYFTDQVLKVSYPYSPEPGAVNRDYSAKVVRLDCLSDGEWGVAVRFLESLGQKSR